MEKDPKQVIIIHTLSSASGLQILRPLMFRTHCEEVQSLVWPLVIQHLYLRNNKISMRMLDQGLVEREVT